MDETASTKKRQPEAQLLDEHALDHVVAGTGTLTQTTSADPSPVQIQSSISKTRAEISMTFARNARA